MEGLLNPVVGDHENVFPPDAVNCVPDPEQIVWSGGMPTIMNGFTPISVEAVSIHPLISVTVTKYRVELNGLATGFAIFGLLSVAPGVHAYADPPEAESCVFDPLHIPASGLTVTDGSGWTVTVMLAESLHPPGPVPRTR